MRPTQALYVTDFRKVAPQHASTQEHGNDWLIHAHARAEETLSRGKPNFSSAQFREKMQQMILKFGCKPDRIGRRSHELEDFTHLDWDRMKIFSLDPSASGEGASQRSRAFAAGADRVFEQLYPDSEVPPEGLIHVTCTGYLSPSGAQKLVSRRGWSHATPVTHAYHMGCYAAFPAVRIAAGFMGAARRVDLVHTEMCTLHLNPSLHTPEQIVVQTLFADGFIRYSVVTGEQLLRSSGRSTKALRLIALREELVPDSEDAMTWIASDWGMRMSLVKEVPLYIARGLPGYLERLFSEARCDFLAEKDRMIFAIHPGGPRIVDQFQENLGLEDAQVRTSRKVLFERGNMSSATLPHVWSEILEDPRIPDGATILALAFGPGLTIAGGLLRKVDASDEARG